VVRRAVAEGLLLKGGGHAMAAGVTLRRDVLAALRAYFEVALATEVEAARRKNGLLIDGALTAAAANSDLVEMINRAGPFGAGNPEPIIVLPAHTVAYAEEVGEAHVRARLKAGDGAPVSAIAFRAAGQKLGAVLLQNRGRQIHAAGSFALDRWNGEERVQFRLNDVAPAEPFVAPTASKSC
jgi:single-stranded-DNA-specific exonuclease